MKTKNKNIRMLILFSITLLVGFSACSLDEKLYGDLKTEGYIQREEHAHYLVNGVYEAYQNFFLYKSNGLGVIMYSGDDFTSTATKNGEAGNYVGRFFDASSNYLFGTWRYYNIAINRANAAIKSIEEAPASISPQFKTRIIAELRFLRGFTYFNMVRAYGGVPIDTIPIGVDSNWYKARKSVDEVYEQIFKDLKFASRYSLPYTLQPSAEHGRATKESAQGMYALANLTYGNYLDMYKGGGADLYYQETVNYCDSVFKSRPNLTMNFNDIFDVEKESEAYLKEIVFGIQFTRDSYTAEAASKGSELANFFQPATRPGVSGKPPMGKGSAKANIQPWFYNQYIKDEYLNGVYGSGGVIDYRTEFSFLTQWLDDKGSVYITYPVVKPREDGVTIVREQMPYIDKYKDPKGLDGRNQENDLYIMRLSELFLIKAEALNELGRTTEAYAPFNRVRERARKANGTIRTVPKDLDATSLATFAASEGLDLKSAFRLKVFNERGLEFVAEGHRWFDAIRMRYGTTTMSMYEWRFSVFYKQIANLKRLPVASSTTGKWNDFAPLGGVVNPETIKNLEAVDWNSNKQYLLYPIPSEELLKNSNFGDQNPGW